MFVALSSQEGKHTRTNKIIIIQVRKMVLSAEWDFDQKLKVQLDFQENHFFGKCLFSP